MKYSFLVTKALFISIFIYICACSQPNQANNPPVGIYYTRVFEPVEHAFTILVPKGWNMEGGIFRVNAATAGGPLNAIEAKCNLIIKNNEQAVIEFHILPDIVYAHPGIGGGFFTVGSNYQGAEVRPITDAQTLLKNIFHGLRPEATSVKVIELKQLPGEKESLDKGLAYTNQMLSQIGLAYMAFTADAAGGVFEYTENEITYKEIILSGLVNMPAAMTWKNTRTLSFRAPKNTFDQWKPAFDIMRSSLEFSPDWILKEAGGQRQRAEIVQKVYDEIRRIDQETLRNTSINRSEIMNDNYLVLTGQEEYRNPHTGKIQLDTDEYRYRWITSGGDVYYTNNEDEDPNLFYENTDFKRTPIRKRLNE